MPPRKKSTTKQSGKKDSNVNNTKKKVLKEPDINWEKRKARKLLYQAIMDGQIPLESKGDDEFGDSMVLKEVFLSIPELAEYDYAKLSFRLSSFCKTIREHNYRVELDQDAFDNFVANNPPSLYSHKGYIQ
jgi:hypothetical protein